MNERQQRAVKLAIGIATVVFLFWFLRESQVVTESMRPSVEQGKLGSPVAAGALAILMEIGIAIGGAVLFIATGLWKFFADLFSPVFETSDQSPKGLTAEQLVDKVIRENQQIPPERRLALETALIAAVELQDAKKVVQVAELLAGKEFFPRPSRASAK